MEEEKLYIGSKLIRGVPCDECSFLKNVKGLHPDLFYNGEIIKFISKNY